MRVAILGLGNMGRGLAGRLAGKAELFLGVREVDAAAEFAASLPGSVSVADFDAAAAAADVVVLALPYGVALEEAGRNPNLSGKVVVDITNPVKADFSGLAFGFDTSAAEELQKAAPGAKVVKAFNTIFAGLFAAPAEATANIPVFVSGNDDEAVSTASELVNLAGFAVEQTGSLDAARLVEPLGMLNIRLGYHLGRGAQIAPVWTEVAA